MSTPCPPPSAEPLRTPPLVDQLITQLAPQSAEEQLLTLQLAWAAAQIVRMLQQPPATPDASWLRLFSLSDRILHRNLRQLQRLRSRPASRSTPSPTPASPQSSPANSGQVAASQPESRHQAHPESPPPPARTRIAPRPAPTRPSSATRSREVHRRLLLDSLVADRPAPPLPFSVSSTPHRSCKDDLQPARSGFQDASPLAPAASSA